MNAPEDKYPTDICFIVTDEEVLDHPNDQQLGEFIRARYYKIKKQNEDNSIK